ncbi:hypothetical protein EDB86DRAFT_3077183 [Lactarius hatsudake]|nr:hypothetical protein EDB86DRAFT_3077183 [Lactarius hatsudake]
MEDQDRHLGLLQIPPSSLFYLLCRALPLLMDTYPPGSVYHQAFLYHNERVGRPYGYIFIVNHPTWTSITALDEPPVSIPQAEDIRTFIALNGDLAPHPAEYPDAITNRLFYRSFRIAASTEAQVRSMFVVDVTLRPRSTTANPKTKDYWVPFCPYYIDRRGEHNVPKRYLESTFWKDNAEILGYVTYYINLQNQQHIIPVEFNFDYTCWAEIHWSDANNKYQVTKPASLALSLDILANNATPAVSPSLASNPEEIHIKDEVEEKELEQIAKSIPTMSQTITQEEIQIRTALFADQYPKDSNDPPPGGDPGDHNSGGGPPATGTPADPIALTNRFVGKEPPFSKANETKPKHSHPNGTDLRGSTSSIEAFETPTPKQ